MRHGPAMVRIALYVADHPGCSKKEAAQESSSRKSLASGYNAVDRAIAARLITGRRVGGRYNLYLYGEDVTQ